MIKIATSDGQFYYDLFYFISIVFAGVFFMVDGKRKKYPLLQWSLIFSSGIVFFIIGTKLFTYSPNDWKEVFSSFTFPYTERKTILGGILGIAGIWIAKKLTRFPNPVLDSLAVSLPVAMAIQRIGCFMVGCCYGTPASVPWAVSYSYHATPYWVHLDRGLIYETSGMSAPVHPNQLYQTVLCLIIGFVVWKLKNKLKRPGSLFFISITLYVIARFIVEFWRDGASNGMSGAVWLGLKYVQWALLLTTPILLMFVFIREKRFGKEKSVIKEYINPLWYFILLCVFVLIAENWFTKTEFFLIELVLMPSLFLQLNIILGRNSNGYRFRLVSVYSLLFVLMLNGTLIAQKTYKELTNSDSSRNTFNDVSFGYGYLQYGHYHSPPTVTDNGCGPEYQPVGKLYINNSNVFGAGITHIETYGKFNKLTIAAEASVGWNSERNSYLGKTIGIFDVSPYIKYDFRWFGASAGFHTGINVQEKEMSNIPYSTDNNPASYFNLSGSLRLFPYDVVYTEIRYNEYFPYQIGQRSKNAFQFVLGSGCGFKDGSGLEMGDDYYGGPFVSGKIMLKNKYGFRLTFYQINKVNDLNPDKTNMFQLSFLYRFDQKHWNSK